MFCFLDSSSDEDPVRGSDLSDDPNYSPGEDSSESEMEENYESITPMDVCETPNLGKPNDSFYHESSPERTDECCDSPRQGWGPSLEQYVQNFEFLSQPKIHSDVALQLRDQPPSEYFRFFLTNEIIDEMVLQTNLYANQFIVNAMVEEQITKGSRINFWHDTNRLEMTKFLGIIGYMGLDQKPSLKDYWSTDPFYKNDICSSAMSRNRFEILLMMWHFSNNEECQSGDRLHKIQPLLDMLLQRFKAAFVPGETICIDESLIPFRGRLIMRQYIPNKANKYGVKVFKLCCNGGYTYNAKIYSGKQEEKQKDLASKVVLELTLDLLGKGRTLITDNYYTSIDLAEKLLENKTHLVGTLRKNRKGIPKEIITKKLKRGERVAKQNSKGITVMKWKDKRDVYILTTKHTDSTIEIHRRRSGSIQKPIAIIDYNKGKSEIDLSDQMCSYNSSLRRSCKWYKKVGIEFIFGTALVNAHILYKLNSNKNIKITKFKELIVKDLLKNPNDEEPEEMTQVTPGQRRKPHRMQRRAGENRKIRKGCQGCKQLSKDNIITKNQIKKVVTYCVDCPGEPFYCLPCFNRHYN